MVTGLTLNLFDFQEKAVMQLLDLTSDSRCKQTIVVKSPTGSGKTSLVNLIPRFADCSAGEVIVDGTDVRRFRLRRPRQKALPRLRVKVPHTPLS